MPKLWQETEHRIEWTDINKRAVRKRPKSAGKRSSGVHLSGVIRHVLQCTGQLKTDDISDEMPLRMGVGMAWEDWVVGLWPDIIWQPGEEELDGVFGSPDGITQDLFVGDMGGSYHSPLAGKTLKCPLVVEEFKCTWKSQRTHEPITNEKIWMWQLAGYCKQLNTLYARLHVNWINGAYPKGAPSPVYKTYLIGYTPKEVDDFWKNVVLVNKDYAVKEEH